MGAVRLYKAAAVVKKKKKHFPIILYHTFLVMSIKIYAKRKNYSLIYFKACGLNSFGSSQILSAFSSKSSRKCPKMSQFLYNFCDKTRNFRRISLN